MEHTQVMCLLISLSICIAKMFEEANKLQVLDGYFNVTLELHKHGSKVAFITFDGKDSNISDWFSSSRILDSSWSGVTPSTIYNSFSIDGNCSRSFVVNKYSNGCLEEKGWLAVGEPATGCCPWDIVPNKPSFLYSAVDDTVTFVSGSTDLGTAEAMAVFVNYN